MLIVILLLLTGCQVPHGNDKSDDRMNISATLFPQYDFARQIGGDDVNVTMVLPPGADSHVFEPSPSDMLKMSNAEILLYTGEQNEPWAAKIAGSLPSSVNVVDVSEGISMLDMAESDHNEHEDHQHGADAHIWLNPLNAVRMAENILAAFVASDPGNAESYKERASGLIEQLVQLDDEFSAIVASAKKDRLVFVGRFAYIWFLERYGLKYETAYQTCSVEAEPGINRVNHIISVIKDQDIQYIFYDELSKKDVAESISRQTNAQLLLFSTAHNLSSDELQSGMTFMDVMTKNKENITLALN